MSIREPLFVLAWPILLLCGGCQEVLPSSISVTSNAPLPSPPTEVPGSPTRQSTVPVPQGKPDAVDGTISPGEWDSAATETFSDGSQLLLMFGDGYLYLGIRAETPEMVVANVFIDRGEDIAILHSSAALGTALYREGVGSWEQTQAFVWRCRKTDNSEAAQAERSVFLEEEHWVAANALMGSPNEMEYQIEMETETLSLAVTFVRESNPNVKIVWPIGLHDDCIMPTPGEIPAQLSLSPDEWATIDTSSSNGK